MAAAVSEALIKTGKVTRGWLGVNLQEMTPALAKSLNLKAPRGALVADVVKGGPAEKAGIRRGDVIVGLDGVTIENANELRNRIAATRAGKKVEIVVLRKGERVTVQSEVEVYKPTGRMAAVEMENRLGMEVKDISILEARKRRLNSREGVLVAKVDPQGPAARAGLEPGDIVHQINQQPIKGLKDYTRVLEQLPPGQEALLLVRDWRTGETGYLTVVVQ
jgi:serine protease Do